MGIEKLREAATRVGASEEVITAETKGQASLAFSVFLLLPAFLLLLAFSAFKRAFFSAFNKRF